MPIIRLPLLICLLITAGSLFAKPAEYYFCVQSEAFETFKAKVTFRSIDFGEMAARQMVYNDLKKHLGENISIEKYNSATCSCGHNCALLEVTAKDWDGNFGNGSNSASFVGSAAEVLDKLASETQEIFTDPGGYLKRSLFGGN